MMNLDCTRPDFLTEISRIAGATLRGKALTLELGGFEHLAKNPKVYHQSLASHLRQLLTKHPGLKVVAKAGNGKDSWELDLTRLDEVAECLSLGLPPRVKPQPLAPRSRPFWLDSAKGAKIELFDRDGVWALWLALRWFFDGLSLRDIAPMLDERARRTAGPWNKDLLARTFASDRLCPPKAAAVDEPKPYVLDWRVLSVIASPQRSVRKAGRKPVYPVTESDAQRLLKGIKLKCRACGTDLDLAGAPGDLAHAVCRGKTNPFAELTKEEAAKLALGHIAARIQQDQMQFFEVGNPFVDDERLVRGVVDAMNSEFRNGQTATRPAAGMSGADPWVLLDRVSGSSPRSVDHRAQVLQWLAQPPEDPVAFRRFWLALVRRFHSVSFDAASQPLAKPHREGRQQADALYSIRSIDAGRGPHGGAVVTVRTADEGVNLGFGTQAGGAVQVVNRCGPDYEDWVAPVREAFEGIALETAGLGAWAFAAEAEAGERDAGCNPFVLAIRSHLKAHPLTRIELVRGADAERADGAGIRERLGAYLHTGSRPSYAGPVIYLYPDRIEASADELGCNAMDLARVVLRHECGHHVAPASDSECRDFRVDDDANPVTMRVEAAAQLFAWFTSAPAERALMERLAARQAAPYHAYLRVIEFAQGQPLPGPGLRPGWLLAWSTVRESHFGEFVGLPEDKGSLAALQVGWQHLMGGVKLGASWPLLKHLGTSSATMFLDKRPKTFAFHENFGKALQTVIFRGLLPDADPLMLTHVGERVRPPLASAQLLPEGLVLQHKSDGADSISRIRVYVPSSMDIKAMRETKVASTELVRLYEPFTG